MEFREIDRSNYWDCISLTVNDSQKWFVADNKRSLVEAAYEDGLYTLGVYHEDTMVGFILYDFDDTIPGWSMSRFMIGKQYQGKGYGKQAVVAFGMLKSTVKVEQLEKVSKGQIKREIQKSTFISTQTADEMHEKKLHFKQEIDVRGMRGDEALQAVTYFIDDAIQVGANQVRILHGTGTGILRQLIREYLASVPGVRRFHDEHVQFGGAGITVVELA